MSAHRPKTAALIAYAEELLSPDGRRRLERHVVSCDVCRAELAAIEAYDAVAEEVRESALPPIDFDRMELALAREARRVGRSGSSTRLNLALGAVGLAFAAAAAALVVYWPDARPPVARRGPEAPVAPPAPEEPAPPAEPDPLDVRVTLVAGDVELVRGAARSAPAPGDALPEGGALRIADGAELHARLSAGTGVVLAAGSELRLRRLREGEVELDLERGELSPTVAHLEDGARFVVRAGGYRVEVRGTRFAVAYRDEVLGVGVDEGVVAVISPDGGERLLRAPARWSSAGGGRDGGPAPRAPRGLERESLSWPLVTLPPGSALRWRVVRWELDGTEVTTSGELRTRARSGEHLLRGWDARGRLFTATLRITGDLRLDPGALRPEAPRVREGHLTNEELMAVVNRGRRTLQQCYTTALRRRPDLRPSLHVRVTVSHIGGVDSARVLDASPRVPEFERCLTNRIRRWTFPPPGGRLTFDAPLTFTATD